MIRLAACVLAVGAGAALAVHPSGTVAAPTATKVVDRTLECTTGVHGGARVIYLHAQAAYGEGKTLEWLAQATVSTAGQPLPQTPNYRPTLAGTTAGWPPPPPLSSGGVGFHKTRCTTSRTRVALTTRGLSGGAAGQLGDEYTCIVPKTMLVRVRGTFREPVELALQNNYYSADGRVVRGQIAVTTLAGKPLVYAEVTDSGTSRLFISKGCS